MLAGASALSTASLFLIMEPRHKGRPCCDIDFEERPRYYFRLQTRRLAAAVRRLGFKTMSSLLLNRDGGWRCTPKVLYAAFSWSRHAPNSYRVLIPDLCGNLGSLWKVILIARPEVLNQYETVPSYLPAVESQKSDENGTAASGARLCPWVYEIGSGRTRRNRRAKSEP